MTKSTAHTIVNYSSNENKFLIYLKLEQLTVL